MQQVVLPIKDDKTLKRVQKQLLRNNRVGMRNYTIFQLGKATLLRVNDVLKLKKNDVFTENGNVKNIIFMHDQKTGKANHLYLKPVERDLIRYHGWLEKRAIYSQWLFPSTRDFNCHISRKTFYKVMTEAGNELGIDYLGTHTMRKTGAYRVYKQSKNDIGLVMELLNHSNQASTLRYLGLDISSRQKALDKIDFG